MNEKQSHDEAGWEDRFDREFASGRFVGTGITPIEDVKSFIRKEKAASYAQGREDALEFVDCEHCLDNLTFLKSSPVTNNQDNV